MASPLFSLILPTFNVAADIGECLASIRRQTCQDYEVLVMDGGSSDKTSELVAQAAKEFGGLLHLRRQADRGVYDAMNQGVKMARGDWLYFIGADDRLRDAAVLQQVAQAIRSHPRTDLFYGDVILRSDARRYAGVFDLQRLLYGENICHQAIFYRRPIFDLIGNYNLSYRIWADWDLNIRCFQHPDVIHRHLDLIVADYNDRSGVSRSEDSEFRKRLPVFNRPPLTLLKKIRRELARILRSWDRC